MSNFYLSPFTSHATFQLMGWQIHSERERDGDIHKTVTSILAWHEAHIKMNQKLWHMRKPWQVDKIWGEQKGREMNAQSSLKANMPEILSGSNKTHISTQWEATSRPNVSFCCCLCWSLDWQAVYMSLTNYSSEAVPHVSVPFVKL